MAQALAHPVHAGGGGVYRLKSDIGALFRGGVSIDVLLPSHHRAGAQRYSHRGDQQSIAFACTKMGVRRKRQNSYGLLTRKKTRACIANEYLLSMRTFFDTCHVIKPHYARTSYINTPNVFTMCISVAFVACHLNDGPCSGTFLRCGATDVFYILREGYTRAMELKTRLQYITMRTI